MVSRIGDMQLLSGSVHRLELSQRDSARRFSLPFKKRRLYNVVPQDDGVKPPVTLVGSTPPVESTTKGCTGEEHIAALALVAVSSSVSKPSARDTGLSPPVPSPTERMPSPPTLISTASPFQHVEGTTVLPSMKHKTAALPAPPVTPLAGEVQRRAPISSATPTPKRVHHPPLASPLPGGCHGRTSRNNSYCRRQPCYNNSNYCKLHYQQYVVAGVRSPASSPTDGSTNNACQDKRFTGTGGEMRCAATTTRGRDCAYTAVNDTKYCFLHSDYDTNPPPRRGNGSKSKHAAALLKNAICPPAIPDLSSSSRQALPRMISPSNHCTMIAPTGFGSRTFSRKSGKGDSASKLLQCDYPLLSSVSSDHWQSKHVLIGIGPLANRNGRVERWGNGWVSVRVADSGESILHNRRSFELFLIPENQEERAGERLVEEIDASSLHLQTRSQGETQPDNGKAPQQVLRGLKLVPPCFTPMTAAPVSSRQGATTSPNENIEK